MNERLEGELNPPFEILEPATYRGPAVFNSPHSGRVYPQAFLRVARLDTATLRRSE
ncbi:MAG: N-formylglutamate amidohydrolase, partial [Variibacter sp.]